jgi:hypothetical protein
MDIQVGDRFTDEEGDWEVVSHPATLHSAKSLRAGVRRAEKPAAERDVTWPAHVRVEIGAVRNRERRPMSQLFGLASSSINVTHHDRLGLHRSVFREHNRHRNAANAHEAL